MHVPGMIHVPPFWHGGKHIAAVELYMHAHVVMYCLPKHVVTCVYCFHLHHSVHPPIHSGMCTIVQYKFHVHKIHCNQLNGMQIFLHFTIKCEFFDIFYLCYTCLPDSQQHKSSAQDSHSALHLNSRQVGNIQPCHISLHTTDDDKCMYCCYCSLHVHNRYRCMLLQTTHDIVC